MADTVTLRQFSDAILIAANIPSYRPAIVADPQGNITTPPLLDVLQNLVQQYVPIGIPVLTGFAGKVFDEEQAKNYRKAKSELESAVRLLYKDQVDMKVDRLARDLDDPESGSVKKRCANIGDSEKYHKDLKEQGDNYTKLKEGAIKIAHERYMQINEYKKDKHLLGLDGVLGVLGVHDTSSWPLKRQGFKDYGTKKHKFRLAYFGGYNYDEREHSQDAPDQLAMRTPPDVLSTFLDKTPFEALIFSGSRDVITKAIDHNNINKSKRQGIRNKVIIVTDPNESLPSIKLGGGNLIVSGANFCDKGYLVLLDPVEQNVAILRYAGGGDLGDLKSLDGIDESKKGMLDGAKFDVVRAINYINGKEVLDINRSHATLAGSITNTFRGHLLGLDGSRGVIKTALPYLVGGFVGAAAATGATIFALSENKNVGTDSGLADTIKKLEQDLEEKGRELTANDAELQRRDKILDSMRKNIDSVRKKLEETTK